MATLAHSGGSSNESQNSCKQPRVISAEKWQYGGIRSILCSIIMGEEAARRACECVPLLGGAQRKQLSKRVQMQVL